MSSLLACQIAGAPIPSAALRNAENEASSLATQVTTTVTIGGSTGTATSQQTITTDAQNAPSVSSLTVISTQSGSTIYVVYPITFGSTKTESAIPSTLTIQQSFTSVIPIIVIGNDGSGSSYTSTTTRFLALSTLTTTNSEGSTVTKVSTYTETTTATAYPSGSGSRSSNLAGSITTITETSSGSSVAAHGTTSGGDERGSKTSSSSSSKNTGSPDSAPFTDTNNARSLGKREEMRWMVLAGLTGFVAMVIMVWA
ncbi:hypothetical protein ACMFMG_008786 [Clarireedia jacksonii]